MKALSTSKNQLPNHISNTLYPLVIVYIKDALLVPHDNTLGLLLPLNSTAYSSRLGYKMIVSLRLSLACVFCKDSPALHYCMTA